jgi:hypothetical protein
MQSREHFSQLTGLTHSRRRRTHIARVYLPLVRVIDILQLYLFYFDSQQ